MPRTARRRSSRNGASVSLPTVRHYGQALRNFFPSRADQTGGAAIVYPAENVPRVSDERVVKHGVLQYDRALPDEVIASYDLVPLFASAYDAANAVLDLAMAANMLRYAQAYEDRGMSGERAATTAAGTLSQRLTFNATGQFLALDIAPEFRRAMIERGVLAPRRIAEKNGRRASRNAPRVRILRGKELAFRALRLVTDVFPGRTKENGRGEVGNVELFPYGRGGGMHLVISARVTSPDDVRFGQESMVVTSYGVANFDHYQRYHRVDVVGMAPEDAARKIADAVIPFVRKFKTFAEMDAEDEARDAESNPPRRRAVARNRHAGRRSARNPEENVRVEAMWRSVSPDEMVDILKSGRITGRGNTFAYDDRDFVFFGTEGELAVRHHGEDTGRQVATRPEWRRRLKEARDADENVSFVFWAIDDEAAKEREEYRRRYGATSFVLELTDVPGGTLFRGGESKDGRDEVGFPRSHGVSTRHVSAVHVVLDGKFLATATLDEVAAILGR